MKEGNCDEEVSRLQIKRIAKEKGWLNVCPFSSKIAPDPSLITFEIASREREETYAVDLGIFEDENLELNGSCTCPDFEIRCLPNFKLLDQVQPYGDKNPNRTQCKHIEIAKRWQSRELTWRILAQ